MEGVVICLLGFVAVCAIALLFGGIGDAIVGSKKQTDGVRMTDGVGLLSVSLAPLFLYYVAFERALIPVDGVHPLLMAATWTLVCVAALVRHSIVKGKSSGIDGAVALRFVVLHGGIAMLLLPIGLMVGEWGYMIMLLMPVLESSKAFRRALSVFVERNMPQRINERARL